MIFLVLAIVFTACTESRRRPLKFGSNVWPGYEPVYLARELGYFSENKIKLVEFASATQVIRSFRNGDVDAIGLTLDEALLLHALNPRVLMVFDISHGADAILGKVESMPALKGKRIAVENTALGAYTLTRALQINNLDLEDITVVPAQVHEHESFYKQGKVDAVVTFEPVRSKLLAAKAKELFNSKQIPGEIVDVLLVSEEAFLEHRENISLFISSWYKALAYLKSKPQEAAEIMSRRMKLPVSEVLASYDGLKLPLREENMDLLRTNKGSVRLISTAKKLKQVMLANELLRGDVSVSHMFLGDSELDMIYSR